MANINFEVSYSQSDNSSEYGSITLNGEEIESTGRLDETGDFVSADGFSINGMNSRVECTRISDSAMRIRLIIWTQFEVYGYGYHDDDYGYGYEEYRAPRVERILESVPINFD